MIIKRIKDLKPSGIREFFDLVLGMEDVVSLGVGEPDFDTPWVIRENAIYTLERGITSYTSNKGLLSLRRQISSYLENNYAVRYDPEEEILITVGVSEALDLVIRTLIDRNDKVLVCSPYYVAYPAVVEIQGGKVVYLSLREKEGFKVIPQRLYGVLKKERPKAMILNYPANPTGISYTRRELQEIFKVTRKFNCTVISDEIYSELSFDFDHTCFSSLKGAKERTVLLGGFSKNFAMTGFRLGYVCSTREIISFLTKIHQYTILCAPTVSQFAAQEALRRSKRDVLEMKKEYMRRRNFLVQKLRELGFKVNMPQGAFYCFVNVKTDGTKFAKSLLKKEKVAVVPGVAFGDEFKNFIRIAYPQDIEVLKEALMRMKRFIKNG